ncbi:outer membrane protein assembly factor BamB family protein [Halorussus amylolyticus]|uniref:outer membrane protein assembly factor BamB family protein n=1 Tax=Halorussus amylolyticus TaxID=1126242 RepID=UPI00104D6397|nr:PQQ-binding-like beta-propeller repeat protein [Halorussus amylolyticus]
MNRRGASRRQFLLGAAGGSGLLTTPAASVPGIRTDHAIRWTFDAGTNTTVYPPHRADGRVFTVGRERGSNELPTHAVYALDERSGNVLWERTVDDRPIVPQVADGVVYLDGNDWLRALDATDGSQQWRREQERGRSNTVVADDAVFSVGRRAVSALDPDTGEPRWTADVAGGDVVTAPVLDSERIYVGGRDGISALDRDGGDERWRASIRGDLQSLAVRNGVVVGVSAERVRGVGATDGSRRWTARLDATNVAPATTVIGDDAVYVWGDPAVAIDIGTGETRWTADSAGTGLEPVAEPGNLLADAGVYATVTDGEFVARDAATGRERWRFDTEQAHSYWGAVTDGLAYVVDETGMRVFDAATGRERWALDSGDPTLWAETAGDLAFAGTYDGSLYAIVRPSPVASAPIATVGRALASPVGLGLAGLGGAGLLAAGYRRLARERPADDDAIEFGRLERLGGGPVTETHLKRVRTPDGPALVAETRLTDDSYRSAFESAVERWADLDADGVLPIRASGSDPSPWFETPYCPAGSLADSWPVGHSARVEAASATARALHAAHREGVVHGRLAPRHVFLEAQDGTPTVRVGGWFLADALADARGDSDPYAPPETESADSDTRDGPDISGDVYRLGALAHHLLAGALPSAGSAPASVDSSRLDSTVATVLARALAPDPADRYDSALAFDDRFRWAALDR